MEETKDTKEALAERIIMTLSHDPNCSFISKEAAVEVLYPQLAKIKTEVRLRSTENWLSQIVSGQSQ